MGQITLICATHRESGKCNVNELIKILQSVGPEVIFDEIRSADFESSYSDESKHTLEMRAIREYLKGRKAQQIPVDDYEATEGFGPHIRALEGFVASRSGAYSDVMDEICQKQFELGFNYLNSSALVSSIKQSERLYQEIISKYGNDHAKNKLSELNDLIRERDASMLENIYRYCGGSDFMEGAFLVGAGHLPSILDGIERRMNVQQTIVAWRFWIGL